MTLLKLLRNALHHNAYILSIRYGTLYSHVVEFIKFYSLIQVNLLGQFTLDFLLLMQFYLLVLFFISILEFVTPLATLLLDVAY